VRNIADATHDMVTLFFGIGSRDADATHIMVTLIGLPYIKSTRTRFSNDVFSTIGRQIWNLLPNSLSRQRGSTKEIGESICRHISDEVNTPKLLESPTSLLK
jgi:hypothetical protein